MTKEQKSRVSYIKRVLKQGDSDRMERLLNGKSIEEIAKNKRSYESFKYRNKVERERVGIQKTLQSMEQKAITRRTKKVVKELQKQVRQIKKKYNTVDYISITRGNIIPNPKNITNFEQLIKTEKLAQRGVEKLITDKVRQKGKDFLLDRYFKLFEGEKEKLDRINKVIDSFGGKLGQFEDFIDHITNESFKGDSYMKSGQYASAMDKYEIMEERLDRIEKYVKGLK